MVAGRSRSGSSRSRPAETPSRAS